MYVFEADTERWYEPSDRIGAGLPGGATRQGIRDRQQGGKKKKEKKEERQGKAKLAYVVLSFQNP